MTSPEWWLRDRQGRWVIVQWPNAALVVWLVVALTRWLEFFPRRDAALAEVGRGALVVWALDEIVRGVNPFRRLLGVIVLVVQTVGFFS